MAKASCEIAWFVHCTCIVIRKMRSLKKEFHYQGYILCSLLDSLGYLIINISFIYFSIYFTNIYYDHHLSPCTVNSERERFNSMYVLNVEQSDPNYIFRPNSALTVHKSGLKHRSSIHPNYILMYEYKMSYGHLNCHGIPLVNLDC